MKIETKNLTKEFKKVTVLDNVSLTFEEGKVYGLFGRNGSGKSIYMKLIAGLLKPTSGEVLINGEVLDMQNNYPKDLRALIETPSFFSNMTGLDNLRLLAEIQSKITDKEILDSLEKVNLIKEKDKKFGKYSLGMKQKLGIAQAIMENPKILLLDEPFNGIEEESVKKIINYLQSIKKDKIIIISSHIREDLNVLCDELIHFDNGKVVNEKTK